MVSVILSGCSVGCLAARRMASTDGQLVDRPALDRHIRSYAAPTYQPVRAPTSGVVHRHHHLSGQGDVHHGHGQLLRHHDEQSDRRRLQRDGEPRRIESEPRDRRPRRDAERGRKVPRRHHGHQRNRAHGPSAIPSGGIAIPHHHDAPTHRFPRASLLCSPDGARRQGTPEVVRPHSTAHRPPPRRQRPYIRASIDDPDPGELLLHRPGKRFDQADPTVSDSQNHHQDRVVNRTFATRADRRSASVPLSRPSSKTPNGSMTRERGSEPTSP